MVAKRTIKVHNKTWEELKQLRLVPEEHFDSVIKRLIATSSLTGGTM